MNIKKIMLSDLSKPSEPHSLEMNSMHTHLTFKCDEHRYTYAFAQYTQQFHQLVKEQFQVLNHKT
jgi:hypothetical protein